MRASQYLTLIPATVTTGIMAGLFFAFSAAVMPGLRGADDRSFVDVMQRINVSIINPLFLAAFMGGLVFTVAAGVVHLRGDGRSALPWIIAGLVLYAVMLVITVRVNIPLNNELEAAGDPNRIGDVSAVRHRFEDTWVTWNVIRTFANAAAFCSLVYALIAAN